MSFILLLIVELTLEGLKMLVVEKSITTSFFLKFFKFNYFSFDNKLSLETLKVIGLITPNYHRKTLSPHKALSFY